MEHDLFLTFEVCFEIEQLVNEGFGWHVGVQSFGFQFSEEFGCTLWAPLQPVDPEGQRGGMAYVPQNVISGAFMYDQLEPAVVSTLRAKERAGVRTSFKEYNDLRSELLNTPSMTTILEAHRVEDDFQPGDVLVFNKWVVHRSITLEGGELPRRAAYVMRLVDADSRYDLQRAQNLELPAELYSRGPFPYKPGHPPAHRDRRSGRGRRRQALGMRLLRRPRPAHDSALVPQAPRRRPPFR